jgi:hypothetical protein
MNLIYVLLHIHTAQATFLWPCHAAGAAPPPQAASPGPDYTAEAAAFFTRGGVDEEAAAQALYDEEFGQDGDGDEGWWAVGGVAGYTLTQWME